MTMETSLLKSQARKKFADIGRKEAEIAAEEQRLKGAQRELAERYVCMYVCMYVCIYVCIENFGSSKYVFLSSSIVFCIGMYINR